MLLTPSGVYFSLGGFIEEMLEMSRACINGDTTFFLPVLMGLMPSVGKSQGQQHCNTFTLDYN